MRALLVLLGLVVVGWTVAWFALASYAERRFDEETTALARAGRADIACGRRDVSGFPFTFVFTCDEDVMIGTDRADIALAGVVARADVASPSTVRARLEGPASIGVTGGGVVRADWEGARTVLSHAFGARRVDVVLSAPVLRTDRVDAAASRATLELSPEGRDLRVRLAADDLVARPAGGREAVIKRLFADLVLDGQHRRLLVRGRRLDPRQGLSGRIERLGLVVPGGGRVNVSGPFSVSPDGLVSGRLAFAVRDADALQTLADALAGGDERIATALGAFALMGTPREIDGVEMRVIELQAVNGEVPFGLFSIDLPRLWRPSEAPAEQLPGADG